MTYKDYIKSSKLAAATLGMLLIFLAISFLVIIKISKYMQMGIVLALIALTVIVTTILWFLHRKNAKIAAVVEIIAIIVMIVALFLTGQVTSAIKDISSTSEYEVVQIVALKDSNITERDNFNSYLLGYVNSDEGAYEKSSEILVENKKKVQTSKPYDKTDSLYSDLLNSNIQLMVLTSTTRSDLSMIDEDYSEKIKVVFEKKYKIGTAELKAVDISKEPFTIYLCGADLSSGEDINSTGRGDVNILLTVNPKTKQVYMQAVPRDTFVYIPCRGGSSKLSYSGWWGGVQSSIESIEDKFGIEINYYAKINFNGLVDLVDSLGGVTVYSHYTYNAGGYSFFKGYNQVDGKKALLFARARKMLPENELSRGQHQMELIKGIFNKFAENPTYENSMAVLNSLSNNFVTNLPEDDYLKAFKLVVELLPKLQNMENHSIEGTYQWHYDEVREGYYQYYYYPADGEIDRVRNNIQAVLDGKKVNE